MASQEVLDQIAEARQAALQRKASEGPGPQLGDRVDFRPTTQRSDVEAPPLDFESQKDQETIMSPDTYEVKLSWMEQKLTLHALSARNQVKFHGFALQVCVDAAGPTKGIPAVGGMRLTAVIAESETISSKVCFYASLSTLPAQDSMKMGFEQATKISAEFLNNCTLEDLDALFGALCGLNHFDEVLKNYVKKHVAGLVGAAPKKE